MGGSKKVTKPKSESVDEDGILNIIRSLGGGQDDLDLINGVSDDDDTEILESGQNIETIDDVTLTKKELSSFIGGLGFNKIVQKLIVVKDDDVDDDAEQEEGQDSDDVPVQSKKAKEVGASKKTPVTLKPTSGDMQADADHPVVQLGAGQTVMSIIGTKIKRQGMVIKPGGKWFEKEFTGIDVTGIEVKREKLSHEQITRLQEYAAGLMKEDLELYKKYQASNKNRSNFHWIETVQKSGTLNDRMAAYIVLVQDSPVHNLSTLDILIKMVNVKNNREGLMAVDTLKDLYIGDLLPESRRLMGFDQHPLQILELLCGGSRNTFDSLLLLWYFESQLKRCYIEFVMALGRLAKDTLETNKNKAIKTIFELLAACPEQEQLLLNHLVNKLGDPNRKLASMGSHLLCRLVEQHSNMKAVVAGEVERLLFRTNVEAQARYYSVCFLNQIMLDDDDRPLAAKLVSIYFSLFKALSKREEVNTRMMSALLTGVNRAFPYAHLEADAFTEQMNATYKIVQVSTFNVAVQALLFIYHALASRTELTDRFYCSLYRKLIDSELHNSSKHAMFLNLLYKSLKKDTVDTRRLAFIKRLFQISFCQSPSMICGSLFLVSEVLRETSKTLPLTASRLAMFDDDDDDEEERLEDVDDEETKKPVNEDGKIEERVPSEATTDADRGGGATWVHRSNLARRGVGRTDYDPWHRNPSFAGAELSCVWELTTLSRHYHPSVALFSRTLAEGKGPVQYHGDPLQDFTLSRFLDRFVYRNPKKPSAVKEGGQAPLMQHNVLGKRKLYTPKGARAFPANSEAFLAQSKDALPVDELFFFNYFDEQRRVRSRKADAGLDDEEAGDDDDGSSVASDELDRLLEQIEPGGNRRRKELDVAADILAVRERKKGKKKRNGDDDDDDMEDEEDDDEVEFEGDDFNEAFKDFDEDIEEAKNFEETDDENEFEDGSDNEDQGYDPMFGGANVKKSGGKASKRQAFDDESDEDLDRLVNKKLKPNKGEPFDSRSLFASAEEFSTILDENVATVGDMGGSEAMANRDQAHVKQLRWEQERDRWVRGADWKTKKRRQSAGKGKPLGKGKPTMKSSDSFVAQKKKGIERSRGPKRTKK